LFFLPHFFVSLMLPSFIFLSRLLRFSYSLSHTSRNVDLDVSLYSYLCSSCNEAVKLSIGDKSLCMFNVTAVLLQNKMDGIVSPHMLVSERKLV
jgi:hypothetical protein